MFAIRSDFDGAQNDVVSLGVCLDLCTMVHKGGLCPSDMGVAPDTFHFFDGSRVTCKKRTFFVRIS